MEHLAQFITNHWPLWGAFVLILIAILINELIAQKKRAKELSTVQAIERINNDNAVVFDLRDLDAFRSGHIINAIHATNDDFSTSKMDKYKAKPVILVCARGAQSSTLAALLKTREFSNVMVLSGGMMSWTADSLPVSKKQK